MNDQPAQPPAAVTIEITADDLRALIREAIAHQISAAIDKRVMTWIETAVKDTTTARVEKILDERLDKVVDQVLTEGWPRTDNYGTVLGRMTLKDWVTGKLKSDNQYGNNPVNRALEDGLKRALDGELKEELAAVRAKFKGLLKGELAARLASGDKVLKDVFSLFMSRLLEA